MNIDKLHTPKVTIANILAIIALTVTGVGWVISQAEDLTRIETTQQAIQKALVVESDHNKERYENVRQDVKDVDKKLDRILDRLK